MFCCHDGEMACTFAQLFYLSVSASFVILEENWVHEIAIMETYRVTQTLWDTGLLKYISYQTLHHPVQLIPLTQTIVE